MPAYGDFYDQLADEKSMVLRSGESTEEIRAAAANAFAGVPGIWANYRVKLLKELGRIEGPIGESRSLLDVFVPLRLLGTLDTVPVSPDALTAIGIHALVVSSAGTGKSTLLRYLAYRNAEGNEILPIYVSLRKWRERELTTAAELESFMRDTVLSTLLLGDDAEARREFARWMAQGRVTLYISMASMNCRPNARNDCSGLSRSLSRLRAGITA